VIAPLDRAAIIVLSEPGVRVARSQEDRDLVNGVEAGRAVVSIDWVTECIAKDELVDLAEYKITTEEPEALISELAEEDYEMSYSPEPARALPIIERQAIEPSPAPRSAPRNATAGPSRRRGSSKQASTAESVEIIHIKDEEDDDDCVFLDDNPFIRRQMKGRLAKDCPPTPPRTPSTASETYFDSSLRRTSESLTPFPDVEPATPATQARQARRDSTYSDPNTGIITDPDIRKKRIAEDVPEQFQDPFVWLESKLKEWGTSGFKGTIKAFFERVQKEVSHLRSIVDWTIC
jgi:hypothetical protein